MLGHVLTAFHYNEVKSPESTVSHRYSRLPKTFRDAIDVVRWLGQQYLWTDSLCIIQDDYDNREYHSCTIRPIGAFLHGKMLRPPCCVVHGSFKKYYSPHEYFTSVLRTYCGNAANNLCANAHPWYLQPYAAILDTAQHIVEWVISRVTRQNVIEHS